MTAILRPKALRTGDVVAVTALSGGPEQDADGLTLTLLEPAVS